jgi:hypothetical protein
LFAVCLAIILAIAIPGIFLDVPVAFIPGFAAMNFAYPWLVKRTTGIDSSKSQRKNSYQWGTILLVAYLIFLAIRTAF